MERQLIEATVEYIPDLQQVDHNLLVYFQRQLEGTCTKNHGFIVRVLGVERVLNRTLSIYNGKLIVRANVEVECFLPRAGLQVPGVIQQVFPQGLIVWVAECMKSFVPLPRASPFTRGTPVHVTLSQLRFQKGRYDCIATLAT